jgi:hypothetical protein
MVGSPPVAAVGSVIPVAVAVDVAADVAAAAALSSLDALAPGAGWPDVHPVIDARAMAQATRVVGSRVTREA